MPLVIGEYRRDSAFSHSFGGVGCCFGGFGDPTARALLDMGKHYI
jgi:hypothetical protein